MAEMAEIRAMPRAIQTVSYHPTRIISAISAISAGLFKYFIVTWFLGSISRTG